MKIQLTSHTKSETADRDTVIGSALSSELAKSTPTENCSSALEISAFLDGGGMDENRDRLMGHFAVCDRCRETYIIAHALNRAWEPIQQSRRGWYMAGGTLAAVALVVLAVKLTIQEPKVSLKQLAQAPDHQQHIAHSSKALSNPPGKTLQQEQPLNIAFSANMAARQLAKAVSADSLAAAIGAPASSHYGFAGSGNLQAAAFRAGNELFELELWLAVGDKERAGLAGERLLPLISALEADVATNSPLGDLLRELDKAPIDDVSRALEALQKTPNGGIIRLGGWVAAAKVATDTGKDPYFGGNPPQQFLKEPGSKLSSAAQDTLRKLNKNKVGNDPTEVRRLLDKLASSI